MDTPGKIKIAIVNTSERVGGAAIAANRLTKALNKNGADVSMLVMNKQTDDKAVISILQSPTHTIRAKWRFLWERLLIFAANKFSRKNLFQVSIANTGFDLSKHPAVQSANIIHLHWINQGFLSLDGIKKLIRSGKPVVWTLHDMWPATGICHYPSTCEKYRNECDTCPLLAGNKHRDLSHRYFRKKRNLLLDQVQYVGCSNWIVSSSKKSSLLKEASFSSIPNPIDTNVFRQLPSREARKRLSLPENKHLILFSAAKISDKRKGGAYFIEACNYFLSQYPNLAKDTEIVLTGQGDPEFFNQIQLKINTLNYISDESELAAVYSAVDLFAIPSLEDNLPNTIMEAMACGTPSVGFKTGGIPEMIDHKENGYISEYKDAEDFAEGIRYILANPEKESMSRNCLEKVQKSYSEKVIAEKYIELYKSLQKNSSE